MVHTIIPDILVMHIEPAQLIYFPANSSKLRRFEHFSKTKTTITINPFGGNA